jgi:hypothetical protein
MLKYFVYNNDTVWYNVIDKIINNYNNTYHDSINKTPNEIVDIINTLTEEDYYSRKEYLEENLVRAETLFLHREDELIKRLLSF